MPQADFSPAADRNKQSILNTLRQILPDSGNALEIASGTGQHIAWFGNGLPRWRWQPSDAQSNGFDSINTWGAEQGASNVSPPVVIDVLADHWLADDLHFDVIFCANMLHIAPWATCPGLMRGSARHLAPGGRLITYGPYFEDGVPASPGNLSFDGSLRAQDPTWGIRRLEDVEAEAARVGLQLAERHTMPANNLLLVWTHTA